MPPSAVAQPLRLSLHRSAVAACLALLGGASCASPGAGVQVSDPLQPGAGAPEAEREDSLFLVVGTGAAPEFEGASSYQPIPFTVFRYGTPDYSIEAEGLGGRLDVVPDSWNTGWGFGPSFSLRLPRQETDEPAIDALDEVDFALEAGAFVRYVAEPGWLSQDTWETRLTLNSDLTGAHNGALMELESDYAWFPERNIRASVGLRSSVASNDFMDAYFGVDAAGSLASGLDAYDPDPGLRSLGAQGSLLYLFGPNHGVFTLLRYDQLVGDVADSPVVDVAGSDQQWLFGFGYTYRF